MCPGQDVTHPATRMEKSVTIGLTALRARPTEADQIPSRKTFGNSGARRRPIRGHSAGQASFPKNA